MGMAEGKFVIEGASDKDGDSEGNAVADGSSDNDGVSEGKVVTEGTSDKDGSCDKVGTFDGLLEPPVGPRVIEGLLEGGGVSFGESIMAVGFLVGFFVGVIMACRVHK